jgi:hypothetical protein
MGRGILVLLAQAKVVAEALEVGAGEGFGEDVGDIVAGSDACDRDFIVFNKLADGVIFHSDVFDLGVPDMIFSQAAGSIVIAVERGGLSFSEANTVEELTKENCLMGCVVQCDVFHLA